MFVRHCADARIRNCATVSPSRSCCKAPRPLFPLHHRHTGFLRTHRPPYRLRLLTFRERSVPAAEAYTGQNPPHRSRDPPRKHRPAAHSPLRTSIHRHIPSVHRILPDPSAPADRPSPSNAVSDGFMNIPDGIDEELPFN